MVVVVVVVVMVVAMMRMMMMMMMMMTMMMMMMVLVTVVMSALHVGETADASAAFHCEVSVVCVRVVMKVSVATEESNC